MSSQREWVSVVGPGALGMLLAASLRRAGYAVAIVGRDSARLRLARRKGFSVSGPGAARSWRGWLSVGRRPPRLPGCAAVFLCVKASALGQAVRSIRACVGPDTAVVSLLNGLTHARPLREAFGAGRCVIGACYIAALRTGPVSVRHMGGRLIHLAAAGRPALERTKTVLENASWKVTVARSIDSLLWTKAVFNAAINPLSALLQVNNGALAKTPALAELMTAAAHEAERTALKAGHKLLYPRMGRMALKGCLTAPLQMSSMAQDLAAGRRTEADAILKPILEAARRRRVSVPLLSSLYRMIIQLERRVSA